MKQDLRALMRQEKPQKLQMPEGHDKKFVKKLETAFSNETVQKKRNWLQWSIAANIALLIGLGILYLFDSNPKITPTISEDTKQQVVEAHEDNDRISLGDLSPELAKIEDYYTQQIQMELVSLESTDAYRDLVKNSMDRLAELDKEYDLLIDELNQYGPNQKLINALIQNSQWKLDLVRKLSDKLMQLSTSSKNEQLTHQL
ncbi:MAG: hypothetical protein OIF50_00450 [Flavobacteriaceae bacterium]|nr:hypothetical protein [Flavobacteriaceae bacterium]